MPNSTDVAGTNVLGVLYLALVLAVVFLPMLLSRRGRSSGEGDSDTGDGWGKPPHHPEDPNGPPPSGIPLDDADASQVRLRDHDRPVRSRSGPDRRPTHSPRPKRVRTSKGQQRSSRFGP